MARRKLIILNRKSQVITKERRGKEGAAEVRFERVTEIIWHSRHPFY